jgi:hypothetical protein
MQRDIVSKTYIISSDQNTHYWSVKMRLFTCNLIFGVMVPISGCEHVTFMRFCARQTPVFASGSDHCRSKTHQYAL